MIANVRGTTAKMMGALTHVPLANEPKVLFAGESDVGAERLLGEER